jgi:hypothetical protein
VSAIAVAGPDVGCPPTFKQATGACDPRLGAGRACVYPEGRCVCTREIPCSGVPRPPGEPAWKCQPKRTDGCPEAEPAQGAACGKPGKRCSYGDCGSVEYTCDPKARRWQITGGVSPPPSAPHESPPPRPAPVASKESPAWRQCPAHQHFGCRTRSQGVAPAFGETIPEVCGCLPLCPASRSILVASEAGGRWPDGSLKGSFTCAHDDVP